MRNNWRAGRIILRIVGMLTLTSVPVQSLAEGLEETEYSQGNSYLIGTRVYASAPTDRARPGVIASWILDISGVALTTFGFFSHPGQNTVNAAVFGGCGLLTAGSLTGAVSLTLRESAYRDAGFSPGRGYSMGGWAMTAVTMVGYANMFVPYDSAEKSTIVLSTIAVLPVVEMLNAAFVRPFWNRALLKSARKTPAISPLLSLSTDPSSDKTMPIFGIKGVL